MGFSSRGDGNVSDTKTIMGWQNILQSIVRPVLQRREEDPGLFGGADPDTPYVYHAAPSPEQDIAKYPDLGRRTSEWSPESRAGLAPIGGFPKFELPAPVDASDEYPVLPPNPNPVELSTPFMPRPGGGILDPSGAVPDELPARPGLPMLGPMERLSSPRGPRGTDPRPADPSQQSGTTTKSAGNQYKSAFDKAMEELKRLEAIRASDSKDQIYAEINGIDPLTGKPKNKDGKWKNFAKGLALALANAAPVLLDRNVSNKAAFGQLLGSGMALGIGNAIKGNLDEKYKLDQKIARAQQQAQSSTGMYGQDLDFRKKEQDILGSEARARDLEERARIAKDKLAATRFKNSTERFKVMSQAIKDGTLSREQSAEFEDTLAGLIGLDNVKIEDWDPVKDKVKSVELVTGVDGGVKVVTVNQDGTTKNHWLLDENGSKAQVMTDRYAVAKVLAANRVETTQMQISSREKIEREGNALKKQLAQISTDQKLIDAISEQFTTLLGLWYTQNPSAELTPEVRQRLVTEARDAVLSMK